MANSKYRIVLNSNIFISFLVFNGIQRMLIQIVKQSDIKIITSFPILAETLEVLRKKFKYSESELQIAKNEVLKFSEIVYPSKHLNIVRDKEDNKVIEAAIEANCNFIITGDKDLLVMGKYQDINIVSTAEFLDLISE
jgi:putative PIN family toxin of toxin-antitoxin system